LIPVHVRNTRDNIIATNTSSPLVSMQGESGFEAFDRLLHWEGQQNFYNGFDVFLAVNANQLPPLDFDGWVKSTKETKAHNNGVYWLRPWIGMESAEMTPADVVLDRDPELNNPAIEGATDRTDVGADLMLLPTPPEREPVETAAE